MALALRRRSRPAAMISVVSLIDVLMILLIFFMVTSTYLDLDMIPAVEPAEDPGVAPPPPAGGSAVLLVRIGADGLPVVQGQPLEIEAFRAVLAGRLGADPGVQIVLFPSPGATMQALVAVMDAATRAGAGRIKVIRLEGIG